MGRRCGKRKRTRKRVTQAVANPSTPTRCQPSCRFDDLQMLRGLSSVWTATILLLISQAQAAGEFVEQCENVVIQLVELLKHFVLLPFELSREIGRLWIVKCRVWHVISRLDKFYGAP